LLHAVFSGKVVTPADRERARAAFDQISAPVNDDLFARSEQEARAGARIIVWSEGATAVLQEDEATLIARASTLARRTGTYLDLGIYELLQHAVQSHIGLDEILLIDPNGLVVWRYEKAHPVPGADAHVVPGDGNVPTVQTPYGRLSNVICFDADFPSTDRQAGQAGADIMLVPSNDWGEIDPYHTQLITFRAIENGYSLVRPTSYGLAMTVDYEGHVLAASDYFTPNPQVMVAYVPMQGVRTLYATIGDLFAWLSLAGLVVLIGVAIARRPKAREVEVAAPRGEPLPVS
jgi:apolipoprotein N-acyltransferase